MEDLKERLRKNNISQAELARRLGVSKYVVNNWARVNRVARKYEAAVNEILGKPKAYGEGKSKLMRFMDHVVPDDFEVKHISMTFNDDGSVNIYLTNNDYEDGDQDGMV